MARGPAQVLRWVRAAGTCASGCGVGVTAGVESATKVSLKPCDEGEKMRYLDSNALVGQARLICHHIFKRMVVM